ncbi:MAG: ABC transporter permease [Spirochaetales bacterium]|nr:ABC transporter permease [Spirochaetales bacterium]
MNPLLESLLSPEFGYAVIRVTTPLVYPALGVAITAKSGTINIGQEGIMLISAFAGVLVSVYTQSLVLALLGGLAAGVLFAALLGYFHLTLKADIILAAVALNLLASGLSILLLIVIAGERSTSRLASLVFPTLSIPVLSRIPILGPIVSGHNILTYGAAAAAIVYGIVLYRTPLGLRIRAVGQNPHAAESVGIPVARTKMYALLISGVLGALGGLYLAMGYVSWFSRDMTAGRGFIAVAAATMGGNLPLGTAAGSLLFGFVNAAAIYISSLDVPSELIQTVPYVTTVIALTVYAARSRRRRRPHHAAARPDEHRAPGDDMTPAVQRRQSSSDGEQQ